MKAALQLDFTYDQILTLVKQLSPKEQERLGKELAVSEYLSSPPCRFTVQELQSEIKNALNEAEQGYGCSQDELRANFFSNE
ncbi:MAG: hypothetical protein Q4G63_06565 [Bacteroidia bacterium]|nr:hypothetical protein [Bacteroidia bacterium]